MQHSITFTPAIREFIGLFSRVIVAGDHFFFKFFLNHPHDCIDVIHHIAVPNMQHTIALTFEPGSTLPIVFYLVEMLTAIDLDDYFLPGYTEIDHIVANYRLIAEVDSVCPFPTSQPHPLFLLKSYWF